VKVSSRTREALPCPCENETPCRKIYDRAQKKQSKQLSVSFIRTLTVGPGITPGQQPHLQLVAGLRAMPLTAGGESHPALKNFL